MGPAHSCALLGCKTDLLKLPGLLIPVGHVWACPLAVRRSVTRVFSFCIICETLASLWLLVSSESNLTGKPFIHPDGSAVVYSPASIAPAVGRIPQQGKTPQQPMSAASQQQAPTNHLHPQVSGRDSSFQSFFFPHSH